MSTEQEILGNYRGLHETTGESYDSIARRVETVDPKLAAELRKEFGESKKTGTPTSAVAVEPEGRQAPEKQQVAEPSPKKAPAKKAAAKKAPAKK